jgi:hypothetical protein
MTSSRRVFGAWALVLSALWVLANLPRSFGLGNFFRTAGFPFVFLFWVGGELQTFDPLALALDIALGLVLVPAVAGVCAWSRGRASGENPAGGRAEHGFFRPTPRG